MSIIRKVFASIILNYLRILSKIQLMKVKPIIVGITGSTGKTSIRDAVALALSVKYKVKKTHKANSESGIPLDILGLHMNDYSIFDWIRVCLLAPLKLVTNWEKYDVYVVEMGVDSPQTPKNMSYLLKILKPHIGLLLNVSAVHSENYDHLVGSNLNDLKRVNRILGLISKEKGKLLKSLPEQGFAIGNVDDNNVQKVLSECNSKIITFGKSNSADVRIRSIEQDKDSFGVTLMIDGKNYTIVLKSQYLPDAFGYTMAGAMAIAYSLKVDLGKAVIKLSKYKLPPGRMSIFKGIKSSTIVDSSYNSSKLSTFEAFNLVEMLSSKDKRKVLLALGDMREMGKETQYEHEEISKKAVDIADRIVLVGPNMEKYFYPKALKLGFDKGKIYCYENSYEAAQKIKDKVLKSGDIVLAKGSQNTIFMESIVEMLLDNEEDISKLCRRGRYWDKMRDQFR